MHASGQGTTPNLLIVIHNYVHTMYVAAFINGHDQREACRLSELHAGENYVLVIILNKLVFVEAIPSHCQDIYLMSVYEFLRP